MAVTVIFRAKEIKVDWLLDIDPQKKKRVGFRT